MLLKKKLFSDGSMGQEISAVESFMNFALNFLFFLC